MTETMEAGPSGSQFEELPGAALPAAQKRPRNRQHSHESSDSDGDQEDEGDADC